LRDGERAVEVHAKNAIPFIVGGVEEVALDLDARVVDADVDATKLLHDARDHCLDLITLRDIRLDGNRLRGERCGGLFRGLPILWTIWAVVHGDMRAFRREPRRDSCADTGACTGDESNFVLKSRHEVLESESLRSQAAVADLRRRAHFRNWLELL